MPVAEVFAVEFVDADDNADVGLFIIDGTLLQLLAGAK